MKLVSSFEFVVSNNVTPSYLARNGVNLDRMKDTFSTVTQYGAEALKQDNPQGKRLCLIVGVLPSTICAKEFLAPD